MNKKQQKYAKDCWDVLFPNGWDEGTQISITQKEFLAIVADGYDLALEDVREDIESSLNASNQVEILAGSDAEKSWSRGYRHALVDIASLIKNLSKKA